MKFTATLLLTLLLSISGLMAQSYYKIDYRSPKQNDTISYSAFLVLQDNGKGFARISFKSFPGHISTIAETEFMQEYGVGKDGMADTTELICRGSKPLIKSGDKKVNLLPLTFLLRLNMETNAYMPDHVLFGDADSEANAGAVSSAISINDPSELRNTAKNYFSATDPLYKNLFGIKTRGELLTPDEKKTKLYLIIAANTKDPEIGPSTMLDLQLAIKTFRAVAKALTIESNFVIDTILGDRYNRTNVWNALQKLNPEKGKDIVVFYYSGHGFTNPSQPRKNFPYIDLLDPLQKPRPDPRDSALNVEDIYTMIKQKGARFNLVISDCCNNRIEDVNNTTVPEPVKKRGDIDINQWNRANVKTLFMTAKPLSFLTTSASKGEKANSKNTFGGYFSYYFFTSMTSYFGNDKTSPVWLQVLSDAQQQTIWKASHAYCPTPTNATNICNQTPPRPKVN